MAEIKVKRGAGDDPTELVKAIIGDRTLPFMASIRHKAVKPLVVPSTGINDVIAPGEGVPFKVKSFEQAWMVVSDSAALAARFESDEDDFVVVVVEDAAKAESKPTSKAAGKAAEAASE